jgi:hypothetical protein
MDEFIHGPKLYLLLSMTSNEILSWTLEIWTNYHLVSDNFCNTVNLESSKILKRMINNVGFTFSVGDTTLRLTIRMEKEIKDW